MRLTKALCLSFLAALALTALGIVGVGGSDIFRPTPIQPPPPLRQATTIVPPTPQELQPWLTPPSKPGGSTGSTDSAGGGRSGSHRLSHTPRPRPLKLRQALLPKRPLQVAHSAKTKRRQKLAALRRPKRWTPQARKLALGTIHLRRPAHGMTIRMASGTYDMRRTTISAHYVIDDPSNHPPLKPNKFIGRSKIAATKHPGSNTRCLPTGGNTVIAGHEKILWGTHDNITGVKYCLPGGGVLPSQAAGPEQTRLEQTGAMEQSLSQAQKEQERQGPQGQGNEPHEQSGARQGADRLTEDSSKEAQARLARNDAALAKGPVRGLEPGGFTLSPNTEISTPTHILHLPAAHQSLSPNIPGALVPKTERRLVDSPLRHAGSPAPFILDLKTVGSHSTRGTVPWPPDEKWARRIVKHAKDHKPAARAVKGTGKKDGGGDGSGLMGSYYTGRDFDRLVFRRPDRGIDFNWTGTLPDPRMPPAQAFSVRWVGKIRPRYSEAYTFYAASDDGERVWINGRLLISNWTIHAVSEDTGQITLKAGHEYDIKVEYFEKNGISVDTMKLYWESRSQFKEYIPQSCLVYPKPDAG